MSYTPSFIVWGLGQWANDMWVRFGGGEVGVYLVGSAIYDPNHKDVDVSIILPTDVFRDRYGMTEREWQAEEKRMEDRLDGDGNRVGSSGVYKTNEWCPAHRKWAREVGGLVQALSRVTQDHGPPDLKVMSQDWQKYVHADKPRLRLDTIFLGSESPA